MAIDPSVLHDTCKIDAALTVVVAAWPELPEAIRTRIAAMVRIAVRMAAPLD